MLLPFSRKGRWFCPSCHEKKVLLFGELITGTIAFPVPHRQYVFSLPIMLRVYFCRSKSVNIVGIKSFGKVSDIGRNEVGHDARG